MVDQHTIEEIRQKSDIVKVVSEFVALKKRGKNYLGLCPFHSEKTASFTVSPEKQLFHCFGCHEGGNVITFLMKIENIGFSQALAELGEKIGILVAQSKNALTVKSEKEKLYPILLQTVQFYQLCLEKNTAAKEYFLQRGLQAKTIQAFGLGYAPEGWDQLFQHLIGRGFSPELIEKAGLAIRREGKNGFYDRFRQRIIIPIFDHRNRVLAFGGRALGNAEPKYLNSPETAIYHKSEVLFGLQASINHIKQKKEAILVEGYFDLLTPFQAGITNLVASSGTALTSSQCQLLARYCEKVIVAFDADSAGAQAAERSIELLKAQNIQVKIALLSGGKDPDEVVQKQGVAAFSKMLAEAKPALEFKIQQSLKRCGTEDIESRARALRQIAQLLAAENDPFIRQEYAKYTAQSLKTDPETILREVKRQTQSSENFYAPNRLARTTSKPVSKIAAAEKTLLLLAMDNPLFLQEIKEKVLPAQFSLPIVRAILEQLFTLPIDSSLSISHQLLEQLQDPELRQFLSALLVKESLDLATKKEVILKDCLQVLKQEQQQQRINALKAEIKQAETNGENALASQLLASLKSEISSIGMRQSL